MKPKKDRENKDKKPEVIRLKCQYCGFDIVSLSKTQADTNLVIHEIHCKLNPSNLKP